MKIRTKESTTYARDVGGITYYLQPLTKSETERLRSQYSKWNHKRREEVVDIPAFINARFMKCVVGWEKGHITDEEGKELPVDDNTKKLILEYNYDHALEVLGEVDKLTEEDLAVKEAKKKN